MSPFSRIRDDASETLQDQVHNLRDEIAALGGAIGRLGSHAAYSARDGASGLGNLVEGWADHLPEFSWSRIGRRARAVETAAMNNPTVVAAGVGLLVVGLVASLLLSRRTAAPQPPARRAAASPAPARRTRRAAQPARSPATRRRAAPSADADAASGETSTTH